VTDETRKPQDDDFLARAQEPRQGLMGEFWDFLRENKKWWLAPIIVTILLLGALAILSGSAAGPFIYTLF
jgi:hypothetical protein